MEVSGALGPVDLANPMLRPTRPPHRLWIIALRCVAGLASQAVLWPPIALAQTDSSATGAAAAPETTVVLPPVEVIAATPLLGSGVDRNKVPAQTQVLTNRDITRDGNADALRALNETVPGVTLDAAAGNPLQPSLFYHGFEASPLPGNPQGLAVYVNGARFNQAFGDTVNWDLIPDLAIDAHEPGRLEPGLRPQRAGRRAVGADEERLYLSRRRTRPARRLVRQIPAANRNMACRAATSPPMSRQAGCTRAAGATLQSSDLGNFYGDLGWRGERGEVHVNLTAAQTRLNGPGTSPVQLLAVDPAAQFTAPNLITNKYTQLNVSGAYDISDRTSVQATDLLRLFVAESL